MPFHYINDAPATGRRRTDYAALGLLASAVALCAAAWTAVILTALYPGTVVEYAATIAPIVVPLAAGAVLATRYVRSP